MRRLGLVIVGIVVLLAAGACGPAQTTDFADALRPPGPYALAGTDHFGRSLALTVWAAAGGSALAAALTAVATTLIGAAIGLLASFNRRAQRLTMATTLMTITLPSPLVTFIIAGITGGGRWAVAIAVAATHWPIAAQLVGPRVRQEWATGWVRFDRQIGASGSQITRWHLAPAAAGRAATAIAIIFPSAVVHEATTAFLGIGVDPTAVSLGTLIAWGRTDIASGAWWSLVVPAFALMLLVIPPAIAARSTDARTALA